MTMKTEASPNMTTTQRFFDHSQDVKDARTQQMQTKKDYHRDLQKQAISEIMKREKDRLYLTEKDLATSGQLMK